MDQIGVGLHSFYSGTVLQTYQRILLTNAWECRHLQ